LEEEERNCREQMFQFEEDVTPADDLVSAEPTPTEPSILRLNLVYFLK